MLGAIIGDIVGSRFEFDGFKSKDFEFMNERCFFTDDTVMTLAVALAIVKSKKDISVLENLTVKYIKEFGRAYPNAGYGGRFFHWVFSSDTSPYYSFGNGSAMRVSACGFMGQNLEEVKALSNLVTRVTHNHPEGLKGAEATAVAIFFARTGKSKAEIKEYVEKFYYPLNFTLDQIRPYYEFNETCQDTVPQALQCFFEGRDFEDCIRLAISLGGDADTLAAITGSIAEAFYGIPKDIEELALSYLDDTLLNTYKTAKEYIDNLK